jgi:hypothetical protein
MIVFDLACECGYSFEGWFQDREQFEEQLASTYLECPLCGGREIHKSFLPYVSSQAVLKPKFLQIKTIQEKFQRLKLITP